MICPKSPKINPRATQNDYNLFLRLGIREEIRKSCDNVYTLVLCLLIWSKMCKSIPFEQKTPLYLRLSLIHVTQTASGVSIIYIISTFLYILWHLPYLNLQVLDLNVDLAAASAAEEWIKIL